MARRLNCSVVRDSLDDCITAFDAASCDDDYPSSCFPDAWLACDEPYEDF
jgi:hypothetical protein